GTSAIGTIEIVAVTQVGDAIAVIVIGIHANDPPRQGGVILDRFFVGIAIRGEIARCHGVVAIDVEVDTDNGQVDGFVLAVRTRDIHVGSHEAVFYTVLGETRNVPLHN